MFAHILRWSLLVIFISLTIMDIGYIVQAGNMASGQGDESSSSAPRNYDKKKPGPSMKDDMMKPGMKKPGMKKDDMMKGDMMKDDMMKDDMMKPGMMKPDKMKGNKGNKYPSMQGMRDGMNPSRGNGSSSSPPYELPEKRGQRP